MADNRNTKQMFKSREQNLVNKSHPRPRTKPSKTFFSPQHPLASMDEREREEKIVKKRKNEKSESN
eukprot:1041200-Amorphochlora_amoeboformis.AAC.1